jgi:hypothetical protein
MRLRNLAMTVLLGMITMTNGSEASPLDEFHWKSHVLVVVGPARKAIDDSDSGTNLSLSSPREPASHFARKTLWAARFAPSQEGSRAFCSD